MASQVKPGISFCLLCSEPNHGRESGIYTTHNRGTCNVLIIGHKIAEMICPAEVKIWAQGLAAKRPIAKHLHTEQFISKQPFGIHICCKSLMNFCQTCCILDVFLSPTLVGWSHSEFRKLIGCLEKHLQVEKKKQVQLAQFIFQWLGLISD